MITVEQELGNWRDRANIAENRCRELLNDNTALWQLISRQSETIFNLAKKIGES